MTNRTRRHPMADDQTQALAALRMLRQLIVGDLVTTDERRADLLAALETLVPTPPDVTETLTCNACGDELHLDEVDGHLASEGRHIPTPPDVDDAAQDQPGMDDDEWNAALKALEADGMTIVPTPPDAPYCRCVHDADCPTSPRVIDAPTPPDVLRDGSEVTRADRDRVWHGSPELVP